MKTAIGYGRFSTDMQREESILAQRHAIEEYCDKNDILLVHFFDDQGISGMTDERPGFQAMIKAAEKVDYVLVHKLDRFARNRYDAAIYRKKLEEHGTKLISVLENFDDSPESIILESVITGMNEYYSRNLAREVKKGLMENARQGKTTGGTPPLGYDYVNGNYVINPQEAEIVKQIFSLVLAGYSYREIAERLNAQGYRSKAGKPFVHNSFYDLLRNEKYIGVYTYNASSSIRANGKRNYHKKKDPKDIIRIENAIPPIIEKNQFEKVQQMLKNRIRKGARNIKGAHQFLLSGLMRCECGEPIVGDTTRNNGRSYHYYRCVKRCGTIKRLRADVLDKWFEDAMTQVLLQSDVLEAIIDNTMKSIDRIGTKQKAEAIQARVAGLETQIGNVVNLLSHSGSISLLEKLEALEAQKKTAEAELVIAKQGTEVTKEKITEKFMEFAHFQKMNTKQKRELLPLLVDTIKVHSDGSITVDFLNVPKPAVEDSFGWLLVQKGGLEPPRAVPTTPSR